MTTSTVDPALIAELKGYEQQLMDPAFRRDPEAVAALLAPDFVEFGASGTVYDKAAIVASLASEGQPVERRIQRFQVRLLGPDAALATCRVIRGDGDETLRSSVWQRIGGRWCIVFHQGTRAALPDEGTL